MKAAYALCKWGTTLLLQQSATIGFGIGWTNNTMQQNQQ
jgi:hypothetical protein